VLPCSVQVEVGGMDAGRVEGAFETCVSVGKFIGVLESFNPPLSRSSLSFV
jgi:hypothetical protein